MTKKVILPEFVEFGKLVKRHMTLNGHRLFELAFALGVDVSNLSRILNGKCNYSVRTYFLLRRYINGDLEIFKAITYDC